MKGILGKNPSTKKSMQIKLLDDSGKVIPASEKQLTEALLTMTLDEREGRVVEFDYEGGLAKNIRDTGKKWRNPAAEIRDYTPLVEDREGLFLNHSQRNRFHNPFNFVPALNREQHKDRLGELGDSKPAGHDRLDPVRWTGRITVALVTKSPLLILDAAKARSLNPDAPKGSDQREHKIFPTRVDAAGSPYLPPTSIKGMLRTAYEAVTNSRLAVFQKHESRVAYRGEATSEGIKPAIVEERSEGLGLRVLRIAGRKIARYSTDTDKRRGEETDVSLKYPDKTLPKHGEKVWVNRGIGRVYKIFRRVDSAPPPEPNLQAGWVCITGPNISSKKNERVFVESDDDEFILLTKEYEKLWSELIKDYQAIHKCEIEKRKANGHKPEDYLGSTPGKTSWSRHIYQSGEEQLVKETLCYVRLNPADDRKVVAIVPVMISRYLHQISPSELLDDTLKPATNYQHLSPADRVFGWASQKGHGGYRGNLRISLATCQTRNPIRYFDDNPVPLAILSQPKPQQTRYYVAKSQDGDKQDDGLPKEAAGYGKELNGNEKGLRGRKVYPHHANLLFDHWETPQQDHTQQLTNGGSYQEYRRPNVFVPDGQGKPQPKTVGNGDESPTEWKLETREKRDDQNRSITGWVKPKTQFSFTIDVTNLSSVELGALLWLLDLPEKDQRPRFHRLGGGKPLGFGSVRLVIDWENSQTDLRLGKQWQAYYQTLDDAPKPAPELAKGCIEEFQQAVAAAYGTAGQSFSDVSFIKAFLRAAEGFTDGLPIHYPRTRPSWLGPDKPVPPHPEGKAFEWFVQNERPQNQKIALPDLVSDQGLPVYSEKD